MSSRKVHLNRCELAKITPMPTAYISLSAMIPVQQRFPKNLNEEKKARPRPRVWNYSTDNLFSEPWSIALTALTIVTGYGPVVYSVLRAKVQILRALSETDVFIM